MFGGSGKDVWMCLRDTTLKPVLVREPGTCAGKCCNTQIQHTQWVRANLYLCNTCKALMRDSVTQTTRHATVNGRGGRDAR
jgi:hypothetical protein